MLDRHYPLIWPHDEPRTPAYERRQSSHFDVGQVRTHRDIDDALRKLEATNPILCSNMPVRSRDAMNKWKDDPGAALYFKIGPRSISICCDLYARPDDNVRAVYKIIEAMRTIERYGGRALSQKAFTGFVALPPPPDVWKMLGLSKGIAEALNERMRREYVMDGFRDRVKDGHANGADMAALVEARDEALKQMGIAS